jgi:multidrug transporter EmrE-like cation transporter
VNSFFVLLLAIVTEIIGTAALKESHGFTKPIPVLIVIVSYAAAFYFMSLALKSIPLGTTYAIWSGLGTAGTVLIGVYFWHEPMNAVRILAIALIIIGVVLLNVVEKTQAV